MSGFGLCGGGSGGGKRVGVGRADLILLGRNMMMKIIVFTVCRIIIIGPADLILGKKCDDEDDCVMFPRCYWC